MSQEKYFYSLSETLKELRRVNGLTQKALAAKLGITYQSYQAYESGKSLPSLPIFIALGDLFDVSLDSLVGRKEI